MWPVFRVPVSSCRIKHSNKRLFRREESPAKGAEPWGAWDWPSQHQEAEERSQAVGVGWGSRERSPSASRGTEAAVVLPAAEASQTVKCLQNHHDRWPLPLSGTRPNPACSYSCVILLGLSPPIACPPPFVGFQQCSHGTADTRTPEHHALLHGLGGAVGSPFQPRLATFSHPCRVSL